MDDTQIKRLERLALLDEIRVLEGLIVDAQLSIPEASSPHVADELRRAIPRLQARIDHIKVRLGILERAAKK